MLILNLNQKKLKNKKDNPNKFYIDEYEDHNACIYGFKLVYVDDRFSIPVQIFGGENAIQKFISKMIKDIEFCKKITCYE